MTEQTTTLRPIGTVISENAYMRVTVVQHVRLGAVMGWAQLERCDYVHPESAGERASYALQAEDGTRYALLRAAYGDYELGRVGDRDVIKNRDGESMRLSFWADKGYQVQVYWKRDA